MEAGRNSPPAVIVCKAVAFCNAPESVKFVYRRYAIKIFNYACIDWKVRMRQ